MKFRWMAALAAGAGLCLASSALAQGQAPEVVEKKDEKRVLEVGKWYPMLETGLNLTQSSYSDNWKGGEAGSISWTAFANGLAEKQINPSLNWLNTMRLLYGQTRQQERDVNGDLSWSDSEESADQIDVETTFRLTKGWAVDPYASVRWESFFRDETDPFGRSLWLNPMTFKESVGIARKFIDYEHHQLLARLGVGARETYRRFFVADTGDATGSETAWDAGSELIVQYLKSWDKKLTYTSRLSFYQPFTWSKKDVFEDSPSDSLIAAGLPADIADFTTTVDIDWQNTLSAQVTSIIAVQLYVELLYDKYDNTVVPTLDDTGAIENAPAVAASVRRKGQFKETLGIGLTYKF